MESNNQRKGFIIALMIFFVALSRLLPHPPNFTAVGAIAIFGGTFFSSRWLAWVIPVLAVWFTDIILNNIIYSAYYDGFVLMSNNLIFTAAALIIIAFFARGILQKITAGRVAGVSLGASAIFFLISNFGAWASSAIYTKDLAGLLSAYTAGLPFFLNTLAGDLFFCTLMFGSYAIAKRHIPALNWSQNN